MEQPIFISCSKFYALKVSVTVVSSVSLSVLTAIFQVNLG